MSMTLRISLIIGIIIYAAFIIAAVKKEKINIKYALLWLLSVLIFFLMVLFPKLVYSLMNFLGFESPINAIFLVFIFIILLILISMSMIVTKQHQQIKKLIQTVGLLQEEIETIKDPEEKIINSGVDNEQ